MDRLEIAQKTRKWAGIGGSGPTSCEDQTGEYERIVDWNDDAYLDVLTKYDFWQFMRDDVVFDTTSGTSSYLPAACSITDHGKWITDDFRCYLTSVSDEQEIFFCEWEDFKRTYLFGSTRTQAGRPSQFSIKPDKSLVFWPVPDDTYSIVGEYYKGGTVLTTNTAEPVFPSRFHMLVVWRSIVYYGADYVEHDRLVFAQGEYKRIMGDLEYDQLPRLTWGKSLC